MTRPFRAWIAAAVAVLAGLAAALLLHHPYVEGWRLLDGLLVVLASAAALTALVGLAARKGVAPRIAALILSGLVLLWLWEMLAVGFALLPAPSDIAAYFVQAVSAGCTGEGGRRCAVPPYDMERPFSGRS